jgi:hypothetical protein
MLMTFGQTFSAPVCIVIRDGLFVNCTPAAGESGTVPLTLIRMTKDEKVLAIFKGLL